MTIQELIKDMQALKVRLAIMKPGERIQALGEDLLQALYPEGKNLDLWSRKGFNLVESMDLPMNRSVVTIEKKEVFEKVLIVIAPNNVTYRDCIRAEILELGGIPIEIDYALINEQNNYIYRLSKSMDSLIMDSESIPHFQYLIKLFQDEHKQIKYMNPKPIEGLDTLEEPINSNSEVIVNDKNSLLPETNVNLPSNFES